MARAILIISYIYQYITGYLLTNTQTYYAPIKGVNPDIALVWCASVDVHKI